MTAIQILFLTFAIIILLLLGCLYSELALKKKADKERKEKEKQEAKKKKELVSYFINQLKSAETLNDIFILHIKIWANGIQHPNFGPNEYGMFRTKDILTMNKNEVFLGNVHGLFTHPLTTWEETDDLSSRQITIEQYRNHLISNLKPFEYE